MKLFEIAYWIDGLTVYRHIRRDPVLIALLTLAEDTQKADKTTAMLDAVKRYSKLCALLYESEFAGNLTAYVENLVRTDTNIFTTAASCGAPLSEEIRAAARNDLSLCYRIATICAKDVKRALEESDREYGSHITALPDFLSDQDGGDWGARIDAFESFHREKGVGLYTKYSAFTYGADGIRPVTTVDPIRLSDLKEYELQRGEVVDNTLAFLGDLPYQNVLLYGDRGTGKSSTVKAILNEYGGDKLRMIEVPRLLVTDIGKVIAAIEKLPLKFILFIDDLTFNENDDNFGILKAVLEGSLAVRPKNVAIYATTNRRHLIKETFSAREGNEVHRGDTLDESLSLSDRFGLTVTFMKPNKFEYLKIVHEIAADRDLKIRQERLDLLAEQFALLCAARSPRVAKQFIDQLEARMSLRPDDPDFIV